RSRWHRYARAGLVVHRRSRAMAAVRRVPGRRGVERPRSDRSDVLAPISGPAGFMGARDYRTGRRDPRGADWIDRASDNRPAPPRRIGDHVRDAVASIADDDVLRPIGEVLEDYSTFRSGMRTALAGGD